MEQELLICGTTLKINVLRNNSNSSEEEINLCLMPALIMSCDRELTEDTWMYGATMNNEAVYHKIQTHSAGYITVSNDEASAFATNKLRVSLCDAKKKELMSEQEIEINHNGVIYALDAGVYYLKVNSLLSEDNEEFSDYKIRYNFSQLNDDSGTNIKDAKMIKHGGEMQLGLQTIQENHPDWYKIIINKATNLELLFDKTIIQSDFKLELFDSKNCKIDYNSETVIDWNKKITVYKFPNKLKKGTYYIKISKSENRAFGYYSIKAY